MEHDSVVKTNRNRRGELRQVEAGKSQQYRLDCSDAHQENAFGFMVHNATATSLGAVNPTGFGPFNRLRHSGLLGSGW